jgi:two-component system, chemotaxis family, protein-glutamate methylesterase/glutaminase
MKKIRVLIVDDSAVVRQVMTEVLQSDPGIEVIGTAADPYQAAQRLAEMVPDVITLDVEMPRMDGLTFLQKLMSQHPIPVVMCSSLTGENNETALKALEYGAVDVVTKPRVGVKKFLEESQITLCDTVKAAAGVRASILHAQRVAAPKQSADVMLSKPNSAAMIQTTEKIIVVGASTGGTEALRVYLENMPSDIPGMVVVQHMPEKFTRTFADRLNSICRMNVKEAKDGDSVLPGQVLIAPGNFHTMVKRSGARYYVEVKEGPLVTRHRPSVDVLFRSAARYAGKNCVGVIMTGMGDDGAQGMLEMKNAGAWNIAQDEESCVVFGMPGQAIKMGGVDRVLPLDQLAKESLRAARL